MKKILFTIIGLSALFCMSSCDEAVYKGRKVYKAYFDYTLKDPESFKVYSEKYTKDGDFTVNWELDYGSKNSLGGMVREKATFTTVGTSIFRLSCNSWGITLCNFPFMHTPLLIYTEKTSYLLLHEMKP